MTSSSRAVPALALACAAAASLLGLAGCSGRSSDTPLSAAQAQQAQGTAQQPRNVAIARGKVEVQGGLLDIQVPVDGMVESVATAEGAEVHKGQVLLRLVSEPARLDVAAAEAELQLAQARQRAQAVRLPAAKQLVQRLDEAAAAGATDRQRADDALQAQREIEAAQAVAAADVQVARQRLAQAQSQLARLVVAAPQDGTVVRLNVQAGSRVDAQAPRAALVLLPKRPLLVRAELNESFAALVKPGMKASVALDAAGAPSAPLPAAHVARLSRVYGPSRLDDETGANRVGLRVVDCFLEFDQAPDLRVGQNVRVSFHD
ncbi:MAG: HlyD family efflux transporter periplasmic adaptor subunit [Pseudomonadota bacterium]